MEDLREKEVVEGEVTEQPKEEVEKEKEIEALKEKIEKLMDEKRELEDKYLRALAELDNFRKRTLREIERIRETAEEGVIKELLFVVDNFERALDALEKGADFNSFAEGVKLIYRQFRELLLRFDVEEIDSLGKPFDPLLHEALLVVEDEEKDNVVVQVVEKGYKFRGNVLRPSKVVVAKKKEVKEDENL